MPLRVRLKGSDLGGWFGVVAVLFLLLVGVDADLVACIVRLRLIRATCVSFVLLVRFIGDAVFTYGDECDSTTGWLRLVWLSLRWGVRFELWIDFDLVWLSLRWGVRFVRPVDFVVVSLRNVIWAADWFGFGPGVLTVRTKEHTLSGGLIWFCFGCPYGEEHVVSGGLIFFFFFGFGLVFFLETRVADWFDFGMGVLTVRARFEWRVDSILVYLSLWWGACLVWQIDLISRWVLTVRWRLISILVHLCLRLGGRFQRWM